MSSQGQTPPTQRLIIANNLMKDNRDVNDYDSFLKRYYRLKWAHCTEVFRKFRRFLRMPKSTNNEIKWLTKFVKNECSRSG